MTGCVSVTGTHPLDHERQYLYSLCDGMYTFINSPYIYTLSSDTACLHSCLFMESISVLCPCGSRMVSREKRLKIRNFKSSKVVKTAT